MKKMIMFLSMSLVLVLGLTSCGCQDKAAVDTTPPTTTPSTGADYNANNNGTVDGDSNVSNGNNGMTGDMGTTAPGGTVDVPESINPDGTTDPNGTVNNGTTDHGTDANGDGVLDDVGRAVGDMARGTERAVRDIF